MNAIETINSQLNEVFAPIDAKIYENTLAWALKRKAAIAEFKASDEYKATRSVYALYDRLHAIAGGKTWYSILTENSGEYLERAIAKSCAGTVARRNASITAKLVKAGVTSVESKEYTHTNDGFNGCYVVNTDAGKRMVTIETIYAGGWNIQCLHLRVLVKVH